MSFTWEEIEAVLARRQNGSVALKPVDRGRAADLWAREAGRRAARALLDAQADRIGGR
jgi:hypothetical protein